MSMQILTTKLYIPATRPETVPRPHLVERINRGLHTRITLISAPAGFGKTTLVSQWINSCEYPVAWLSLDEQDNDPHRFLAYFIAALQTVASDIGEELLKTLHSAQPPAIDSLLTALINVIATIPQEFFLVLDDYHILDEREIDSALSFLLDHLPPQMHLVMTTREDPQLPLARLRARGQLTEVRASDLRFTLEEASEFLSDSMGLDLSADDISALEVRTEGWIAGLQLAALSLRGRTDIHSFVDKFAGDHRYIVDYLVEEVLQRQPKRIHNFLLQTSILDRLSSELCAAVTNRKDTGNLLESLERANLFIIHLDDERQWYRYHHLFADVLRAHLMKEQSEQVPILHRRASEWYEQNSWHREAIHHALIIDDYERAADLVEMTWPIIPKGIRPSVWRSWIQKLPEEQIRVRPILSAAYAWILIDDGELDAAAERLDEVDLWLTEIDHDSDRLNEMVVANMAQFPSLVGTSAGARAYLTQAIDDHSGTIYHAQRALDLLPEGEHYWRGGVALLLGLAQWRNGDLGRAYQSIKLSVASLRKTNDRFFHVAGASHLGRISYMLGHLNQAHNHFEEALDLVNAESTQTGHLSVNLFVGLAHLYCERDELETANHYVQRGMALRERAILSNSAYRMDVAMARICTAQQDYNSALDWLAKAQKTYKQTPDPDVYPIASLRARIWIRQGRISDVTRWLNERGLSMDDDLHFSLEFDHITVIRLSLAQFARHHKNEVLQDILGLIDRLIQTAEEGGRKTHVIELLILQSLAHHAHKNRQTAVATLQRALKIAEPEGFVRIFVDEGEPMKRLLSELISQNIMPDYTRQLLNAFDTTTDFSQLPANQALIEPLSERELEILQLVADGLSNQEISEQLYLALSTVKGHNRNIYGKLGVSRRTEAVALARELGLIRD